MDKRRKSESDEEIGKNKRQKIYGMNIIKKRRQWSEKENKGRQEVRKGRKTNKNERREVEKEVGNNKDNEKDLII